VLAAEEIATAAEYVPGARFGFTEAVNESGVVPPPLTVSQLSPLLRMGTAVTCSPEGLLKTEMLCAAGGFDVPCVELKPRDAGLIVIFAGSVTFMVTEVVSEETWSAI